MTRHEPLDAQAAEILREIAEAGEGRPEPRDATEKLARARADTNSLQRFSAPVPEIDIRAITIAGRCGPIPVEICRPASGDVLPLIVWFHGGGAIAGSIGTHRAPLAALASRSGWAVASVGYALAPEHPFPRPLEDCVDALRGLAEAGAGEGFDTACIVVGGDSIGGAFAAVAARLARDEGSTLAGQVILYPNTDMRTDRGWPSLVENEGQIMTRASLAYEAGCHIPDEVDRTDPRASPLLAPDLEGLPPAFFVTCGHDPLRDEGEAYARRLVEAGVSVTHLAYPAMIHAFFQMGARIDACDDLMAAMTEFLHRLR
ncbi:alpha/beta hydrolase [Aureimonas mangrovi]|uniref:alpha/beta hydrolase n=1 Tax=Aureimonas mangrovi TaxID=2758041 RepID=UPI00163D9071|nr:alpha/beta hydrolase [Aureimonas mangrovi]